MALIPSTFFYFTKKIVYFLLHNSCIISWPLLNPLVFYHYPCEERHILLLRCNKFSLKVLKKKLLLWLIQSRNQKPKRLVL